MTVPVLRVSEPRDLLAYVPHRLGFHPRDSLVLVCLRGPRNRLGLVLRADLPPPDPDGAWLPALAAQAAGHAARDGAVAAVAAVYREGGEELPARLVGLLDAALADLGIGLREAWHVGGGAYRSLTCADPRCCPPQGRPLTDLDASLLRAEMVVRGEVVLPDRQAVLGDLSPLPGDVVLGVEEAAARDDRRRRTSLETGLQRFWRSGRLALWRDLLASGPASGDGRGEEHEALGRLLAALADPTVRDAVMMTLVPGAGLAPERHVRDEGDAGVADVLESVFGPSGGTVPDGGLADRGATALRHLVRCAGPHRRAAPLGVLAWLAWWLGEGALANDYAGLALEADPGYSLARLVEEALAAGLAPGWVEARRREDAQGLPSSG
jgi:hypothetical protein